MLQIDRSSLVHVDEDSIRDSGSGYGPPPSEGSSPADLLAAIVGILRRQIVVILSVIPVSLALAIAYLFTTPPLYTATASLLIDPGRVQVFKQSILGDTANPAVVYSQIEILKSESFALSVIKRLQLDHDPEFVSPPKGLISTTLRLLHLRLPAPDPDPALLALGKFQHSLVVTTVPLTYVIEVQFQSVDPERAAQIANGIADTFILDQVQAKYKTIGTATTWLQERLNELRAQASAAERAIVEFKTKNNIVDSGGGRLINEQQLAELNTALTKAHSDTSEAKARLDRLSQILNAGDLDPSTSEVATVGDALKSEVISKFRIQYLELAQREVLLSAKIGHDHLAMVNLRNQMREIRRSIFDELKRIASSYQSEYNIAKARESALEKSLASTVSGSQTTNKAQIELRQLESSAQSYRALYDNFQQRYTDSVQQQSFPIPEAQVIATALAPSVPSSPKAMRILAIAAFGGLAVGAGLGMLREMTDRVFRTSGQVESRLRTECIAMVPLLEPTVQHRGASKADAKNVGPQLISTTGTTLRHVVDSPLSQFAESIRAIKVTADLSGSKVNKIIGITSSLPNEGKSTIAMALAQLCAHSGARVILVDSDLRKRSLSRDLTPNARKGIIEVLTEAVSLEEVIWSDPATKLSFLPAVATSRLSHTSEVIASAAMKRLFSRLRDSYDYVIVDLSPLAPVVDVRAATHLVDTYVFIVEWGKTNIGAAERALNTARGVYDNLLGVVLNKVNFVQLGRYDNNTYYARYGYYTA